VYGFMSSPAYSHQRPCLGSGSIFGSLPVSDALVATQDQHAYTKNKHNKDTASSCFACLGLVFKPYAQHVDSVDEDELPTCSPSSERRNVVQMQWIRQSHNTAQILPQCLHDLATSESELARSTPRRDKMMDKLASESDSDSSLASKFDTFSGSVNQGVCHILAIWYS